MSFKTISDTGTDTLASHSFGEPHHFRVHCINSISRSYRNPHYFNPSLISIYTESLASLY